MSEKLSKEQRTKALEEYLNIINNKKEPNIINRMEMLDLNFEDKKIYRLSQEEREKVIRKASKHYNELKEIVNKDMSIDDVSKILDIYGRCSILKDSCYIAYKSISVYYRHSTDEMFSSRNGLDERVTIYLDNEVQPYMENVNIGIVAIRVKGYTDNE